MTDKPCVFCDRTQFEERLIAEDENFYVVATLGQITDGGYTLLIPKKHTACAGVMVDREIREAISWIGKIRLVLWLEYQSPYPTVFEHGIVGQSIQHAHIHFVPTSFDFSAQLRHDFPRSRTLSLSSWSYLPLAYRSYVMEEKPYLLCTDMVESGLAMIEDGLFLAVDPPAPMQYFRTALAEALGRPERANWRTMDPELDKRLWSETVTRLKPYFV